MLIEPLRGVAIGRCSDAIDDGKVGLGAPGLEAETDESVTAEDDNAVAFAAPEYNSDTENNDDTLATPAYKSGAAEDGGAAVPEYNSDAAEEGSPEAPESNAAGEDERVTSACAIQHPAVSCR